MKKILLLLFVLSCVVTATAIPFRMPTKCVPVKSAIYLRGQKIPLKRELYQGYHPNYRLGTAVAVSKIVRDDKSGNRSTQGIKCKKGTKKPSKPKLVRSTVKKGQNNKNKGNNHKGKANEEKNEKSRIMAELGIHQGDISTESYEMFKKILDGPSPNNSTDSVRVNNSTLKRNIH